LLTDEQTNRETMQSKTRLAGEGNNSTLNVVITLSATGGTTVPAG